MSDIEDKYANAPEADVKSDTAILGLSNANHLEKLYDGWFLDYASYVILDRAVPYFEDGLKPVQRRILHTLSEMNNGHLIKVANVVGATMRYHPHGDSSIYTALVGLGQKDLLIDTQGNWGNPLTGDGAAAGRYIEGRLSQFAQEILFNPETTEWIPNYDGTRKEPVTLPAKFPLLLAQGVDLVVFPQGTRVPAGAPRRPLRRGAAQIALHAGVPVLPVRIACAPPVLAKGQPWYDLADRTIVWTLRVGNPIPVPINAAGSAPTDAASGVSPAVPTTGTHAAAVALTETIRARLEL